MTAPARHPLHLIDLPPVWLAAAGALAAAAARIAPLALLPLPDAIAAIPAALGAGLILWAALFFLLRRTPIEPRKRPSALLVEGPFRINRNPIYTGMALILLGWGLHLGAVSALLAAPLWLWWIDRRFVRGEEAALREAFGPEAAAYLHRSRRW